MKYKKEISFLLSMLCLMVLLAGCRDSGNRASDDIGVNESEVAKELQTDDSDRDTMDTEDILPSEETVFFAQKSNVNLAEGESNNRIVVDCRTAHCG